MHIAIDARIINSSTGRYVERLLHYLEKIDRDNHYTVLVRAKDETYWTPSSDNFTVRVAEFDNYSLAEQTGFKRFLDDLNAEVNMFRHEGLEYMFAALFCFHAFGSQRNIGDEEEGSKRKAVAIACSKECCAFHLDSL